MGWTRPRGRPWRSSTAAWPAPTAIRRLAIFRRAVESARDAVRVNPASHTLLHDLAWTLAQYSAATRDAAAAREAVDAMRSAVELYPNWPRGHLQLGMLLAGAGERTSNGSALLRDAVAEFDTALRLDEQWPADDPNKFDAKDLAELRARRQRVLEQLQAVAPSQPATLGPTANSIL